MSRIRNSDWESDENLKADLQKYVLKNLKRSEVLDFVRRDYPQYSWSIPTLSRRMAHFDIRYVDYSIDVKKVEEIVLEELNGPGKLLGYRAMHKKLREQHQLLVPRGLVYDLMTKVDPEGLEKRGNIGVKKRRRGATGTLTSLVRHLLLHSVFFFFQKYLI